MSTFAPENFTSPFAQTGLSFREIASAVHPLLYPNFFADIVVEEETVIRVECLEPRDESNDEEELIDVVGGGEVGVISGAELENFTLLVDLRCANLIAASDLETVLDTFGMPICN